MGINFKLKSFKMEINKEKRGFFGAIGVFIAIMGVLVTLFFVRVPTENNDIVKVIIGMLVSALSMILYTLAGKDTNEISVLKNENELLRQKNRHLTERIDSLESMFMKLQTEVINKLSVLATSNNK